MCNIVTGHLFTQTFDDLKWISYWTSTFRMRIIIIKLLSLFLSLIACYIFPHKFIIFFSFLLFTNSSFDDRLISSQCRCRCNSNSKANVFWIYFRVARVPIFSNTGLRLISSNSNKLSLRIILFRTYVTVVFEVKFNSHCCLLNGLPKHNCFFFFFKWATNKKTLLPLDARYNAYSTFIQSQSLSHFQADLFSNVICFFFFRFVGSRVIFNCVGLPTWGVLFTIPVCFIFVEICYSTEEKESNLVKFVQ